MPRLKKYPMYTPWPNRLGGKRKEINLTMADLAEVMEMKAGTYASIESGHTLPSKRILLMLKTVFKCEASDLYDDVIVQMIEK